MTWKENTCCSFKHGFKFLSVTSRSMLAWMHLYACFECSIFESETHGNVWSSNYHLNSLMHKGNQDVSEIYVFQHHQHLISSGSTETGVKGRLPGGRWIHLTKLYYRWTNSTRFPSSQMATALVFVWTVPWKYCRINLWIRQIVVSPLYVLLLSCGARWLHAESTPHVRLQQSCTCSAFVSWYWYWSSTTTLCVFQHLT